LTPKGNIYPASFWDIAQRAEAETARAKAPDGPWHAGQPTAAWGTPIFSDAPYGDHFADIKPFGSRAEQAAILALFTGARDLADALKALLPEVDAEIEQRQSGGLAEDWQSLKALSDAGHKALAQAGVA